MTRILVIDDNDLISQMLKEALTDQGYEVKTAADANQGYAEALKFSPGLIILDVQLPDVTGFDLAKMMKNRSELRDIPIIMVTGTARTTEEKVKGFQLGIDDYLLKPFDMPELLERVRAVLRRQEGKRTAAAVQPVSERPLDVLPAQAAAERMSVVQAIGNILLTPAELPAKPFAPGISLVFILFATALSYAALAFSAAAVNSWALVAISILGFWGLTVAVLVMGSSLLGIPMNWKEGSGLVSLAASPLLLKLSGALVTSAWTTLSPLYYSAGLSLFVPMAPRGFERLDIFELWSVYLLWSLLCRWPGSSRQKAGVVSFLVWASSVAMAFISGSVGHK